MILFKRPQEKGQALTEMILVIPLLVLMLAGIIQLIILFQARIAFEKTCGDVAREYDAGLVSNPDAINQDIWDKLGVYQKYFKRDSLTLNTEPPQPTLVDSLTQKIDSFGPWAAKLRSYLINYEGQTWTISINCQPPFLPAFVLPNGIGFQTQLTALRYPA